MMDDAGNVSWDDIRFFLAVAQAGSLNAAAKKLGVDHTTVGRRIKAFEGRMDADLFDRERNGLRLTPDGEGALHDALSIQTHVESFVRKLKGSNNKLEGTVRVDVTEGIATYWLIPKIQPFLKKHPLLTVNFSVLNSAISALGKEVDMAVRWHDSTEPYAVVRKLGVVKYSLYAMPSYVEKHGLPSTFGEFHGHNYIQFNGYEAHPGFVGWNMLMRQVKPGIILENTTLTQKTLETGDFIALLPDYVPLIDKRLVKAPLDLGVEMQLTLVYHEDRRQLARIQALADEIQHLFDVDRGSWFS